MMRTELAQLVHASQDLQEVLGDADVDALLEEDPQRTRQFLVAVREDPRASVRLCEAIDSALDAGIPGA